MKVLVLISFLAMPFMTFSQNYSGQDFSNMNLRWKDFSGRDLKGANFNNAILTDTDFRGSDLRGSSFIGAIFCGEGWGLAGYPADLRGAKVDYETASYLVKNSPHCTYYFKITYDNLGNGFYIIDRIE